MTDARDGADGSFIGFARPGLFPIGRMLSKAYPFDEAGAALADWDAAPGKVCRMAVML